MKNDRLRIILNQDQRDEMISLRKQTCMSINELSEATWVSAQYIRNAEQGRKVNIEYYEKLLEKYKKIIKNRV